jgi:ribonuclease BN (tRNA processing enzyme)
MELTILGSRAGMPADGQASSGYLVTSTATRVLLDCGPGIATALSAVTTARRLTAVVISHLHLDHCYDLLPLGKTLLAGVTDPAGVEAVPLYVPAGAAPVLHRLGSLFPVTTMPILDRAFDLAFDIREYEPGQRFAIGDLTASLHELRHAAPDCGVRLDGPQGSIAYTGDTGVTPGLVPLASEVDLLLAEATLVETDPGPHGHLSATDAGRAAQAAGARSLVLTHFPTADPAWLRARRQEAAAVFPGTIHIGQPGDTFPIRAR